LQAAHFLFLAGLCLCGATFAWGGQSASRAPEPSKYTGPGSCSSTSCHGSVTPRAGGRIFQNEYSIWVVQDKHAKAYTALTGPIGQRMGRLLAIGKPEESPKCLACHALDVPPEQRAKTFDLSDGVSCESCHGPASAWLGEHTTRGWTHAQSVALGMYDTRDLVKRAEKCLGCHLGNQEQFVDHEMIAAGHPDLYFELDSFTAIMPRHWKVPRDSAPGVPEANDPWHDVRDWGTGQAVQLRAWLARLQGRARGPVWPEYSEMDCFACHHSLTSAEQSWRQERGYSGRRPGDPPWNISRYAVFRELVRQVDPGSAEQLDAQLTQLSRLMSRLNPDRDAVASAAASAEEIANRLIERIQAQPYDQAMTLRLLERISADADEISGDGERSAEQATMALDSLFIAYTKNAQLSRANELRAAINELFALLENPSAYNPNDFSRQMHKVNSLLP
jgi:Cytochrome c554 and c-prime